MGEGFTQITDGQLRALIAAGATGQQFAVYALLSRYHGPGGTCSVPRADVADALHMDPSNVSRAIRELSRARFRDGEATRPVLERVSGGHNGRVAVYRDNLWLARGRHAGGRRGEKPP